VLIETIEISLKSRVGATLETIEKFYACPLSPTSLAILHLVQDVSLETIEKY
jgi:hypothetical protein